MLRSWFRGAARRYLHFWQVPQGCRGGQSEDHRKNKKPPWNVLVIINDYISLPNYRIGQRLWQRTSQLCKEGSCSSPKTAAQQGENSVARAHFSFPPSWTGGQWLTLNSWEAGNAETALMFKLYSFKLLGKKTKETKKKKKKNQKPI